MNLASFSVDERRQWAVAGGIALAAHLAVGALAAGWVRQAEPVIPEPVVLVELPPEGAPAAAAARQAVRQPQPDYVPPRNIPRMAIPPVKALLPKDPVVVPTPAPMQPSRQPVQQAAQSSVPDTPAASRNNTGTTGTGTGAAPGNDPRSRAQVVNYGALVSAYLARRKNYPVEAKQARQQGVVMVRFTVDRSGNVSVASIKRSSGHTTLDQATIDLLRRVAPLPRMPAAMQQDSITLSLPIEYSLKTD